MAKYRLCMGFAVMPDHDMALLKDMSSRGWHVRGMSGGALYRFEQGEPHAYDYEVDFVRDFSPAVQELFRIGGWEPVVTAPGWQILRAEAGTTPLYTDDESKVGALRESRARVGKTAVICALAALSALGLERWFSAQGNELGSTIFLIVLTLTLVGLVCSVLPFVGYSVSIGKMRR